MLKPITYLLLSAALVGTALAEDTNKAATPAAVHAAPTASADAAATPDAAAKQEFRKNMKHANPLPNYMVIITEQADALKLTAEQKTKVDAWVNENTPKAAAAVKNIIAAEQALLEASLGGAGKDDLMKQFDEMAAMRRALAEQKAACSDYMRQVLTPEQWEQTVKMQREALASK